MGKKWACDSSVVSAAEKGCKRGIRESGTPSAVTQLLHGFWGLELMLLQSHLLSPICAHLNIFGKLQSIVSALEEFVMKQRRLVCLG